MDEKRPRLAVGISGASGVLYGVRVLDACRELGVETHLVVSRAALLTLAQETALSPAGLSDIRMVNHYDRYYLDRHQQRPLPVILAVLNDAGQTRLYINPKVARVAGSYSAGSWMDRWLYHGLHSLDFPWLYNHRPAWDIVMIAFMLGGTALSVTSFVLAWRVLGRLFTA